MWAALAGAGDEAGRDGWKGLKRLITGLYEARRASRAPQGGVTLKDSEPRVEIQLPPDLPDEAYRRLWEMRTQLLLSRESSSGTTTCGIG